MKKITKRTALIFSLCLILSSSAFAFVEETGPGGLVKNTCKLSFNLFGLVRVWSGEKTYETTDIYGHTYTYTVGCGEDGGSWDWFWE